MRLRFKTAAISTWLALSLIPAGQAQWLHYPTPGIPRTPDGKPDLAAPVPKTADGKPDLSGIWETQAGAYELNIVSDLKAAEIQPWADAIYRKRLENFSIENPGYRCLPEIGPAMSMGMFKILQTPGAIAFLAGGDARQVLTDGRPLPKDPNPTWRGYSVGHWDRDTLVIETAGFNDKTWLDFGGHPHTEALRVTERFHRKDFGHMEVRITFEDPKAYNKPWTISLDSELKPDTELLEYVCNENERDVQHFVVTDADRKKNRTHIDVVPAVLSKYTGVYEAVDIDGKPVDAEGKPVKGDAKPITYTVRLADGQLRLRISTGGAEYPLEASSDTVFSVMGTDIEFVRGSDGTAAHLIVHAVEGDQKAIRKGGIL